MNAAASEQLDATFAALADPTRRAILTRLTRGEATVKELAAPFEMSQPAISKHLKLLERAGLVSVGQDAQRRPRRLVVEPLAAARACIERYRDAWEAHFKRLDVLLEELQEGPPPRRPRPQRVRKRRHLNQKKQTRKKAEDEHGKSARQHAE